MEQGISHPSIYQFPQIADFYNITIQRLLTGKEKDESKIQVSESRRTN